MTVLANLCKIKMVGFGLESKGIVGHFHRHIGSQIHILEKNNTIFDNVWSSIHSKASKLRMCIMPWKSIQPLTKKLFVWRYTEEGLEKEVCQDQPVNNVHQIAPVLMTHGVVKLNISGTTRPAKLTERHCFGGDLKLDNSSQKEMTATFLCETTCMWPVFHQFSIVSWRYLAECEGRQVDDSRIL